MNNTKGHYEGCSKMATIFLMVKLQKKELLPVIAPDFCIEKEPSIIKTLKAYAMK